MFFFSLFPHTLTPRSFFFLCFPTLVLLAAVRSYNNAQNAGAVAVAGGRGVTGGGVPDDTRDEGLRAAALATWGYGRRRSRWHARRGVTSGGHACACVSYSDTVCALRSGKPRVVTTKKWSPAPPVFFSVPGEKN